MAEPVADPFFERLMELPGKRAWVVLLTIDIVAIVGVYTGLLGAGWLVFAPTVCCASVLVLRAALLARRPLERSP